MLVKIDKADIPMPGGREKTPMRLWAEEQIAEFMGSCHVGDCCEVTGWPAPKGADEFRTAAQARDALYDAAFRWSGASAIPMDGARGHMKLTRRGSRLFMERTMPPKSDWRRTAVDAA